MFEKYQFKIYNNRYEGWQYYQREKYYKILINEKAFYFWNKN